MPAARVLPHEADRRFLTDGGLETSLIFDDGLFLPHFAAFHLLRSRLGQAALVRYYGRYLAIAQEAGLGFVLESPTWRANPDWGGRLQYSTAELTASHGDAISLMQTLRDRYEAPSTPILVSGCVGPRGDGDIRAATMSPDGAETYHDGQIAAMASAGCDLITAMTMTNVTEAIGIVRAATRRGLPCVVSFTVETDGRIPSGLTLEQAVAEVDTATVAAAAYYMINCAHPSHFMATLKSGPGWTGRLGGVRANASRQSHAELSGAVELDRGNADELAADYRAFADTLPGLRVFGGCCGTNHRHVLAMATALTRTGRVDRGARRVAKAPSAQARRPKASVRSGSPRANASHRGVRVAVALQRTTRVSRPTVASGPHSI